MDQVKITALRKNLDLKNASGQAILEYVLLLAILVGVFSYALKKLSETRGFDQLKKPLTKTYPTVYRYGHPDVKGQEDGGPIHHAMDMGDEENFRIFINPPKRP